MYSIYINLTFLTVLTASAVNATPVPVTLNKRQLFGPGFPFNNLNPYSPFSAQGQAPARTNPFGPSFPFGQGQEGVMDPFGPDFPYEGLSGNVKDALSNIQQQNLGGFCSELISVIEADDNDDDDDNGGGGSFQPSKSSSSNINSNGNSNSNVDTGGSGSSRSSSSSYSNSNGRITGSVTGPGGYSYTYSNSETIGPSGEASSTSNYYINGVRVPEALTGYQPMTIQSACEQTKKEGTDTGHGELSSTPASVPSMMGANRVPVYYQTVYYGSGSNLPLSGSLTQGLPAVPYRKGEFGHYRQLCGQVCAQEKSCGGFTVDTDYNVNHCNLVMGRSLGREDFIDEEMGGDGDGRYHLEGFKKGRGRG